MGRWAQRRRRGGATDQNYIVQAAKFDVSTIQVYFAFPLDVPPGYRLMVHSLPSNQVASEATSAGPNIIQLDFEDPITTDTSLLYDGDAVGILTPQSVTLV